MNFVKWGMKDWLNLKEMNFVCYNAKKLYTRTFQVIWCTVFFSCVFKTTYMLTFPWESFLPCVRSSAVTSRLRRSVPFAPQMFSPFHVHHSTSKLAPWCPFHGLTAFSLFGQALDRLVTVSSIHYCTSTSALSTSSSSRGLTSFEWDISSWGGLHA